MLKGRFGNTSDAPFLEGRVAFPRLGVRGLVSFLVDTGADSSIFMPTDGVKLGIDYSSLRNQTSSDGIGGSAVEYSELALVSFTDTKYVYSYVLRAASIAEPTSYNQRFPSLLGRYLLHQWRFVMNKRADRVTFTPLKWDLKQRI